MTVLRLYADIVISYDGKTNWEDGSDLSTIHTAVHDLFDGIANVEFDNILLTCAWDEGTETGNMRCSVQNLKYGSPVESDISSTERDTLMGLISSAFDSDENLSVDELFIHKKNDDRLSNS